MQISAPLLLGPIGAAISHIQRHGALMGSLQQMRVVRADLCYQICDTNTNVHKAI